MSKAFGKFVWYDVITSDLKAAESFYTSVIGWEAKDFGMPGPAYTVFSAGSRMVAGLMPFPDGGTMRACWSGYIWVADVDDYAARVQAAGGTIHRDPQDIPEVGRFCVVADPHGAVFILFHPNGEGQGPPPVGTPGLVGWHELHAGDLETDFPFYANLFGWTKAEAIDMGPMGIYQTFATGGDPVGGMMTKMAEIPAPFWLYYFNVEAIDAAVLRVNEGGGKVLFEPHQVPGGSWIVQCLDPQGAMFAMSSPNR